MSTSVHFYREGDDELADDLTHIYSNVVPRVGDAIHYYIDTAYESVDPSPPATIMDLRGVVTRVEVNYRDMRDRLVVMVLVYLKDCKVELQKKAAKKRNVA